MNSFRNYRIEWVPKDSDVAWTYDFTMASDNMAKTYAQRLMQQAHVRLGCMGLLLLNIEYKNGEISGVKPLACYKYKRIEAHVEDCLNEYMFNHVI